MSEQGSRLSELSVEFEKLRHDHLTGPHMILGVVVAGVFLAGQTPQGRLTPECGPQHRLRLDCAHQSNETLGHTLTEVSTD